MHKVSHALLGFFSVVLCAAAANAETVQVKYRGAVLLDTFECPALKPSSLVSRICYDRSNSYLIVQLKSTYYHYCDLPIETVESWINSNSLGRFYNQNIKAGIYGCQGKTLPEY